MGRSRVSPRRQIESQNRQAQLQGWSSHSRWIEEQGESDGMSLCLMAATCVLVSSFQNFRFSLSSEDGFTNKEYGELVTGTMEVAMCGPYIFLLVHEYVLDLLPTTLAALAPWKSCITCRPNVRIFRDTTILVVISYLILLDINLSFGWLAIFPVMAIVFIGALYFKFSRPSPGSSNVAGKTNRKTQELKIIVMVMFGALIVMDQLPDHAAEWFPISQFLLFLSSTVAALTRMLTKLPAGASLPGVAPASEMLHKTLLLLLLVTAHTGAAEWLGEDVVLLCLPEVIHVLLWSSLHVDRKPAGSLNKMTSYRKSLLSGAMVAALIAYLAISMDEFGLSSSLLVPCGVSGMLTYSLEFVLSHWPRQLVAAAGKDGSSGMLK